MSSLLNKLHPLERKVLPYLDDGITYSKLVGTSGMKDVEVMRALQWLSNKKLVQLDQTKNDIIKLDSNGKKYSKTALPEIVLLKLLKEKPYSVEELFKLKQFSENQEVNISIGLLKKKAAITIQTNKKIAITDQGKKLLEKPSFEENFLKKDFPVYLKELKPEEKFAYDNLIKRKNMLIKDTEKVIFVQITPGGKKLLSDKSALSEKIEDNLTHNMLSTGKWKKKKFRHYDIKINVPRIHGGKRHFVRQSIDYIKRVWLELGFKEMEGNLVQSAFWDLDTLFVPQDHPARTEQDTFYIKDPSKAKLPINLKKRIKAVHENGSNTGSKGWRGKWSEQEASLNMLRTHTTVLSARAIAALKKSGLPAKFFSVNKVFRNEALTWKHLFEFHQVEGIVVDPNATLKHLKGYLRNFYHKLGFDKVRMRPGEFPYTSPSIEIDVFHPVKKEWIELGGAGIFRPEVVIPLLGEDIPVLAWGQGLERGIMDFYKFKDIRQLYNNDLKLLKETKIFNP